MRHPAIALLIALTLAGCGREKLPAPGGDRPALGADLAPRSFPAAGIAFASPADWGLGQGPAPLVAESSSGTATMAVWRYPRTEPLPEGDDRLDAASDALAAAVRARDGAFREVERRTTEVAGEPAIVIVGEQSVAGQRRRVRSTHVFAHGAEIVVDQYAPPADFQAVDVAVFMPVLRSLRIAEPRR